MQEIKFRGRLIYNGEWVYGGFLELNNIAYIVRVERQTFEPPYLEIATLEEVDPETVGQYTGLKDKNGKDIYDGDIVESSHPIYDGDQIHRNTIQFKDFCWRLIANGEERVSDVPLGLYARQPDSIVVIGNIHDNPDLLEG